MDLKNVLEELYEQLNKPRYISPDPLEIVLEYTGQKNCEAVGIIASSFAVGRVQAILKAVRSILKPLKNPYEDLMDLTEKDMRELYGDFKYRYYKSEDLIQLLTGLQRVFREYGTVENCVASGIKGEATVVPGVKHLADCLGVESALIPFSTGNSAFKRVNLFIRWMVRKDAVDPGFWKAVSPSQLIIPLDTHILNLSQKLELTSSSLNNMKNALRITEAFRRINQEDPVKYDFSLSRLGIHPDFNYSLIEKVKGCS